MKKYLQFTHDSDFSEVTEVKEGLEIDSWDFNNFISFVESITPKNKRIGLFIEENVIMIGYFPEFATMADLSKPLPKRIKSIIKEKIKNTNFTFIDNVIKPCPITDKPMFFSAITSSSQDELLDLEKIKKL
jgi:hypothetical protein